MRGGTTGGSQNTNRREAGWNSRREAGWDSRRDSGQQEVGGAVEFQARQRQTSELHHRWQGLSCRLFSMMLQVFVAICQALGCGARSVSSSLLKWNWSIYNQHSPCSKSSTSTCECAR